jgi:hypothetical protein
VVSPNAGALLQPVGGCVSNSNGREDEEYLSVAEAALRYGLPQWKVTKLIRENQLEGARKIRGTTGRVWSIPAAAIEALGYTQEPPTPASAGATVTVDLAELRRTINGLTGSLRIERQRLINKEEELQDALVQVRQLRSELRRERERREEVEVQLAAQRGAVIDLTAAEGSPARAKDTSQLVDLSGVDRFALRSSRGMDEGG